jgi:cell division septal protein FtsQ
MTPEERTAFEKRRRQRSWAIFTILLVLVVLFYFISIGRLLRA